jgi:hypothetical protein
MITNQVVYSIVVVFVFVHLVALVAKPGYHYNIDNLSLGRDSNP